MQGSLAQTVISAWERGLSQHPLDRALTLLSLAQPDASWSELASLPIGRRDERLLSLHEAMFGGCLRAAADCPACGEALEFQTSTRQLMGEAGDEEGSTTEHEVALGGRRLRVRLLDSRDLAEAARADNGNEARDRLITRCLVDGLLPLTDEDCEALSARLMELDPRAEILIKLDCPTCEHAWSAPFDPAAFVWNEVAAAARRLLRQVHELASAYHWNEAAILEMSPQRRAHYLALVPS